MLTKIEVDFIELCTHYIPEIAKQLERIADSLEAPHHEPPTSPADEDELPF